MPVVGLPHPLDTRALPKPDRCKTVLSTFDALRAGETLVVITDHDPHPLLKHLQAERKGLFEWSPLQEGPAEWRTEIARRDAGVGALRDVTEALGWDHDRLEELEARAFAARGNGDFAAARARFGEFAHGLARHIRFEEQILFPAFEERSGIQPEAGPTAVMRAEHREIERLLQAIVGAIGDPASRADGLRQDLHAVLALHNMKEEQVVYPDTDGMLAASERDALVARIQAS